MRIFAVANQKGGVGKTTTAITMGAILADSGYRVLLLDLDPQGSMSSYFGAKTESLPVSIRELFVDRQRIQRSQLLSLTRSTSITGLSLMPSNPLLYTVERDVGVKGMGRKIANALEVIESDYDFVFIDTAPVLGTLMINAMAACDKLLVPVQTEFLAIKGLERMLSTIEMVAQSLKKDLNYLIISDVL